MPFSSAGPSRWEREVPSPPRCGGLPWWPARGCCSNATGRCWPPQAPASASQWPWAPAWSCPPTPGLRDPSCSGPCLGVLRGRVQSPGALGWALQAFATLGLSWVGGQAVSGSGSSACEESSPRGWQLLCSSVPLPYLSGPTPPSGASAHPSQAGSRFSQRAIQNNPKR